MAKKETWLNRNPGCFLLILVSRFSKWTKWHLVELMFFTHGPHGCWLTEVLYNTVICCWIFFWSEGFALMRSRRVFLEKKPMVAGLLRSHSNCWGPQTAGRLPGCNTSSCTGEIWMRSNDEESLWITVIYGTSTHLSQSFTAHNPFINWEALELLFSRLQEMAKGAGADGRGDTFGALARLVAEIFRHHPSPAKCAHENSRGVSCNIFRWHGWLMA